MKLFLPGLLIILSASCVNGKEKIYIGSTPATSIVVRSFLGIPMADSVDFIKWKFAIEDNRYSLQCQFGISKPNTDGFMNDGTKVELRGDLRREKNYYHLQNGNKTLMMLELNNNLLHILTEDKTLLVGNSGWSYTLNIDQPSLTDKINIISKQSPIKDSIVFEGRTPCSVPGIIPSGMLCYKLKWYIILYTNAEMNTAGTYRVYGTPYRKEGGRTGNWKLITGEDGRIIYQLNNDRGGGFLFLLKLDENIVVLTHVEGKLLVGDKDFSFTLNRRS